MTKWMVPNFSSTATHTHSFLKLKAGSNESKVGDIIIAFLRDAFQDVFPFSYTKSIIKIGSHWDDSTTNQMQNYVFVGKIRPSKLIGNAAIKFNIWE